MEWTFLTFAKTAPKHSYCTDPKWPFFLGLRVYSKDPFTDSSHLYDILTMRQSQHLFI
jgi:hypothetical protein